MRIAGVTFALSLAACGSDSHPAFVTSVEPSRPSIDDSCAAANEGCACEPEGATADCAETASIDGNAAVCIEGQRACTDGRWGACVEAARVTKYVAHGGRTRTLGLATSAASCQDLCNPRCSEFVDDPSGVDPGAGFVVDDGALTLLALASASSCSDVIITPSSATITVDGIAPLHTTPGKLALAATCGVGGPAIAPSWSLGASDSELARIDASGTLTVVAPIARDVQVTARTTAGVATANITVRVNAAEVDAPCSDALSALAATDGRDPGHTLYPYAVPERPVLFPLGLRAPSVQWATGGVDADCVKVALRYPAGTTNPLFAWSRIVAGSGGRDPRSGGVDPTQPALPIEQAAWSGFDRSARGDAAEILLQRRPTRAHESAFEPLVIPVRFASDSVRATLYYTQYTRRFRDDADDDANVCAAADGRDQRDIDVDDPGFATAEDSGCAGGDCGAAGPSCPVGDCTRVDEPGAASVQALALAEPNAAPVDPFHGAAQGCPVCHSVSADGTTAVGSVFADALAKTVASIGRDDDGAPAFAARADAPAYTWNAERGEDAAAPHEEQSLGFANAAISPDGRFVLQGPNFWGNTQPELGPGDGNVRDASYEAGGKRFFLIDLHHVRTNLDRATDGALPEHAVNETSLRAAVDGALVLDGEPASAGQRVLVKDEPLAAENGVYVVSDAGGAGTPWTLTREASADEGGPLVFGDRMVIEGGRANAGKIVHLAAPVSSGIVVGRTAVQFSTYTTVMAASSQPLPDGYAAVVNVDGVRELRGDGALPSQSFDDVPIAWNMTVLVKDESGDKAPFNGIYTLTSTAPWVLTRRADADRDPEVSFALRVRVNQGSDFGGRTFALTSPGPVQLDDTPLAFEIDDALDEAYKLDQQGGARTLPTMMYPVFSPDGHALAYVSGDGDRVGDDSSGWRRGLSSLRFDPSNTQVPFSDKRRILNTYADATPGPVLKSPFFEPDSRSLLYVQGPPDEFCALAASRGECADSTCASTGGDAIDTDVERACFRNARALGYGSAAPIARGFWSGAIHAVDSESSRDAELTSLNAGLAAQDAAFNADRDKSYEPSVLPFAAGGYRWAIFTSTRAYGNQLNAVGTHFSCTTPLLWMAAIDDELAGERDRSHPAFLVPGQNMRSITDPESSRHFVNERAMLVASPCKGLHQACSESGECCGANGINPSSECLLDGESDTPRRTCEDIASCAPAGDVCTQSSDCCGGAPCGDGVCVSAGSHRPATFVRTYAATCPTGYGVRWGDFEWHAEATLGSRIVFRAQVARDELGLEPAPSIDLASADALNVNPPTHAAQRVNVGARLKSANVPSAPYLRISMDFGPSADGTVAPILYDWDQRYDCIAIE